MHLATAKAYENNSSLADKTDANEYFSLGVHAFSESKFVDALDLFNKSVLLPSLKKNSLYNLACCCVRLDKITDAIQYLLKSIDSGSCNWNELLTDPDLTAIIDRVEIVSRFSQYCNEHPDGVFIGSSINDYITRHSIVCNSGKTAKTSDTQYDYSIHSFLGYRSKGHSNE
jgi:tetratricopeptide (TPR) repeat protein